MKKALCTIFCEGKEYKKGEVYADKDVKHLDQADFETITEKKAKEEKEAKKKAPKGMKTEDLKPKK